MVSDDKGAMSGNRWGVISANTLNGNFDCPLAQGSKEGSISLLPTCVFVFFGTIFLAQNISFEAFPAGG